MIRRFGLAVLVLFFSALSAQAGALKPYQASQFEQAMANGETVVVHVHAEWCPVCHRQIPALQSLSDDPALSGVEFVTVDFDTDKNFLSKNAIPTQSVILVFKGGQEVERLIGVTDSAQIQETVKGAIG